MRNATDELRRLLDERGVEYESEGHWFTRWSDCGTVIWDASECEGRVEITGIHLTPEQAIEAIEAPLGNGTRHVESMHARSGGRQMSNATDELRRLLDERGVKYESMGDSFTECCGCGTVFWQASEWSGYLEITVAYLTPEQAIEATEATLGNGTRHVEVSEPLHEKDVPAAEEAVGQSPRTGPELAAMTQVVEAEKAALAPEVSLAHELGIEDAS